MYQIINQMPKLYFRYGTMNSSKTANLLMLAHNYKSQGKRILLIKPGVDTRTSVDSISSRAGIGMCIDIVATPTTNLFDLFQTTKLDCILVDECQFLSPQQIEQLRDLSLMTPVMCYGLRSDYKTHLFPGSKRLMELADNIEEVKSICIECCKKSIINAKFSLNDMGERIIIREGSSEPDIGSEEKYQAMCWSCYSNN